MEFRKHLTKAAFWSRVCSWLWGLFFAASFLVFLGTVLAALSGGKIAKEFYESDSIGMYTAIIGVFILLVILYYIYACFRKYAKECDRGIENFSAEQIEQILLRQVRIIRLYGLYKLAYVLFFVIFFLIGFFGFLATR